MPTDPRLVPVTTRDGRHLHVEHHGEGPPQVVFESGMGASRNEWGAVVEDLTPEVASVVYDRSGLGRSPAADDARDLDRLADDLSDVLDHLPPGPFVLVGHSWGGPIVRASAARSPDRVAGLVLVDATDEGAALFFSKASVRSQRLTPTITAAMARTGLLRRMIARQAAALPEPWASAMRAEDGTPTARRTLVAEMRTHLDGLIRLRDEPLPPPAVPVTVITGARTSRMERGRRDELLAAHRARAGTAVRGRHVVAERSGHYVPLTEPVLVADEIRRILATGVADGPDDHATGAPAG